MKPAFDKPLVCPSIIGRQTPLEALEALLQLAGKAKSQILLLNGEAGIGKSRLIAEAIYRARRPGWAILQGNCFESDLFLPFAPFIDLLRTFLETLNPAQVNESLGPAALEFIKLVPELVNLLPGGPTASTLEPEQEKRRLFQALTDFLLRQSQKQPVLIAIEDLHWIDGNSLEFLLFLVRQMPGHRILLILTYRSNEIGPALTSFLANLDRLRLPTEMSLANLSRDEVGRMITEIFNLTRPVRGEFLDTIFSLTEGNPFFVEEILKALVSSGDIFYTGQEWDRKPLNELRIPRSVFAAVHHHTEELSPEAGELLSLAAVAGRRFNFSLLKELSRRNESELLQLVKVLVAAQLVVEQAEDQFAFRHALTREAVYSQLLIRERRALHLEIAGTIESHFNEIRETYLVELAYHYYEAHEWTKALEYSRLAGEKAQKLSAPREARDHFNRALEAAGHLQGVALGPLLVARGHACELLGEFDQAKADYEQALALSRQAGDEAGQWQNLLDLGFLWTGLDYDQAGEYFQLALEIARKTADPRRVAVSLNRYGNWLGNTGRSAEGLELHREAHEIFQTLADKQGIADTTDLMAMAYGLDGNVLSSFSEYKKAVALYRELGDSRGLASGLSTMCVYACGPLNEPVPTPIGDKTGYKRLAVEALQLAIAIDWQAGQAYAEESLAQVLWSTGDFGEGLVHGHRANQLATEIRHRQWMAGSYHALGEIYTNIFDTEQARQVLEAGLAVNRQLGSSWWRGHTTAILSRNYLQENEPDKAEAVLMNGLPRSATPRNLPELRVLWGWGELALYKGQFQEALAIFERLTGLLPPGTAPLSIPWLLKLKGEALAGLGRLEDARPALETALEGARACQLFPLEWEIGAALARLLAKLNLANQAHAQAEETRLLIEKLAASLYEPGQKVRFLKRALAYLPEVKPAVVSGPARSENGKLTRRELEIVRLVSQGKSSPEIAKMLFLSQRTVETHISNILGKLNLTNRAQIAAWAVQNGLGRQD
jgi:DNA-binding CsgD family transcriptional regulator